MSTNKYHWNLDTFLCNHLTTALELTYYMLYGPLMLENTQRYDCVVLCAVCIIHVHLQQYATMLKHHNNVPDCVRTYTRTAIQL